MIGFKMMYSAALLTVWIDCPTCGRFQKLSRELRVPLELAAPVFERACAVCDQCGGAAVMCFERQARRVH